MSQDPSLILTKDVEGAPVRIGERVKITSAPADDPRGERYLGCTGVVMALVFDDPGKQYPEDPLIQVRVPGVGTELFFAEELELAPEWARRQMAAMRRFLQAAESRNPADLG
jgi:hypothetical protein